MGTRGKPRRCSGSVERVPRFRLAAETEAQQRTSLDKGKVEKERFSGTNAPYQRKNKRKPRTTKETRKATHTRRVSGVTHNSLCLGHIRYGCAAQTTHILVTRGPCPAEEVHSTSSSLSSSSDSLADCSLGMAMASSLLLPAAFLPLFLTTLLSSNLTLAPLLFGVFGGGDSDS